MGAPDSDAEDRVAALQARVRDLEARLALRTASEAVLQAVDEMFEGVQIIGADWRYRFLNRAAAEHGQRARDTLVGQCMTDAYPGIEATPMFARLRACMETRVPQRLLNRFTYPEGGARWFELRVSPIPDGILVLSVDVTDAQELAATLAHREAELRATLTSLGEALIATDRAGQVTLWNPASEALLGWSAAEAAGRPLDELLVLQREGSGERVESVVARVLREEAQVGVSNHTVACGRDGRAVPVYTTGSPVRHPDGSVHGAVMVLRDVSREAELQAQLRQAHSLEMLGRLAGEVAHDFNNLLQGIGGMIQLARDFEREPERLRADLTEALAVLERARGFTGQLLALARQSPAPARLTDVGHVVEQLAPMLRRLVAPGVTLDLRLPDRPLTVQAPPGQLDQLLLNLCVNARDAMPNGGRITIAVADVALAGDVPGVELRVSDTGPGIPPDLHARVFEPFFSTKGERGTGLGLAICGGVVERLGGTLAVESPPGAGATFVARFPAAFRRRSSEAPAVPSRATPPGATVLIVDDDPLLRSLLRRLLDARGLEVVLAESIDHARTWLRSEVARPSLVLTDLRLPDGSGIALLHELRHAGHQVPAVLMSGALDAEEDGRLDGLEARFLAKPFAPKELDTLVTQLLGVPAE